MQSFLSSQETVDRDRKIVCLASYALVPQRSPLPQPMSRKVADCGKPGFNQTRSLSGLFSLALLPSQDRLEPPSFTAVPWTHPENSMVFQVDEKRQRRHKKDVNRLSGAADTSLLLPDQIINWRYASRQLLERYRRTIRRPCRSIARICVCGRSE